jgi:hypothetical protein
MTAIVPQRTSAPMPGQSGPLDAITAFQIRVSQYAVPLLEFTLSEAGFVWRDLVRNEIDATVVIETPREQLDDAILALRQRFGGNLCELRSEVTESHRAFSIDPLPPEWVIRRLPASME